MVPKNRRLEEINGEGNIHCVIASEKGGGERKQKKKRNTHCDYETKTKFRVCVLSQRHKTNAAR